MDTYGPISVSLLSVLDGLSNPDTILEASLSKIRSILAHPVSLAEIIKAHPEGLRFVEKTIKISLIMSQYVQTRRHKHEHTLYLLRDCLLFNELHHTLDIIEDRPTSHDQVYIGRKILSNAKREGGHWYVTQEILFSAYLASPNDFGGFYADYSRRLQEYEAYSSEFSALVQELVGYIEKHIGGRDSTQPVRIIDLGFQGSINMLLKYIIDIHCKWSVGRMIDMNMFVVAEWFKSSYGADRYSNNTYGLLTYIEEMARNEYLYEYLPSSLENGALSVQMCGHEKATHANLELITVTMSTMIAHQMGEL
jgi:hypothetical protein